MARLKYNGLRATLGGSGLTASATAVTFGAALTHSNGVAVPTIVAPDYIPFTILDASGHESEIVWLTAYTSGATTGTIGRGKEGTTGVTHAAGDTAIHSPTAFDDSFHGCAAERTAVLSIPTGAYTVISLNSAEAYDTDGIHDLVTNPSRFTIPAGMDGRWRFTGSADIASSSSTTSQRAIGWSKNGTMLANRFGFDVRANLTTASYGPVVTTSVDLLLGAGDYVECAVFQDSGGALNLTTAYVTCQYLG